VPTAVGQQRDDMFEQRERSKGPWHHRPPVLRYLEAACTRSRDDQHTLAERFQGRLFQKLGNIGWSRPRVNNNNVGLFRPQRPEGLSGVPDA